MRVVVADATPLHYLILIDAIFVIPRLFEKIHVPIEVRDELICDATPTAVRTWMQRPPEWAGNPRAAGRGLRRLFANGIGQGERAAIALAQSIRADLLLIDDRAGAMLAQQRGLAVTGTLGVLDRASRAGLVQLRDVFVRLQKTNFRYPPSLMETLPKEERMRRNEDV